MDALRFEKITWDNFEAIMNLRVNKEQRSFVARNKDSLVHAYLAVAQDGKQVFPFGIYLGKKPVGFIMIGYDIGEDDGTEPCADWFLRNSYFIWRFMIDRRYQGKGYGREALQLALDFIRTFPAGEAQRYTYDVTKTGSLAVAVRQNGGTLAERSLTVINSREMYERNLRDGLVTGEDIPSTGDLVDVGVPAGSPFIPIAKLIAFLNGIRIFFERLFSFTRIG